MFWLSWVRNETIRKHHRGRAVIIHTETGVTLAADVRSHDMHARPQDGREHHHAPAINDRLGVNFKNNLEKRTA